MSVARSGYVLGPGEGESYWFFNALATVKAGGRDTDDAFTLMEFLLPPGFGPPMHVHHQEDEAFYLLEGGLTVTCGDDTWRAGAGSLVFLPKEVPHAFTTWEGAEVRMLQLTTPSQFEHFAAELGQPAERLTLPEPVPLNVERVMATGLKYDIEFLGGAPPA